MHIPQNSIVWVSVTWTPDSSKLGMGSALMRSWWGKKWGQGCWPFHKLQLKINKYTPLKKMILFRTETKAIKSENCQGNSKTVLTGLTLRTSTKKPQGTSRGRENLHYAEAGFTHMWLRNTPKYSLWERQGLILSPSLPLPCNKKKKRRSKLLLINKSQNETLQIPGRQKLQKYQRRRYLRQSPESPEQQIHLKVTVLLWKEGLLELYRQHGVRSKKHLWICHSPERQGSDL